MKPSKNVTIVKNYTRSSNSLNSKSSRSDEEEESKFINTKRSSLQQRNKTVLINFNPPRQVFKTQISDQGVIKRNYNNIVTLDKNRQQVVPIPAMDINNLNMSHYQPFKHWWNQETKKINKLDGNLNKTMMQFKQSNQYFLCDLV